MAQERPALVLGNAFPFVLSTFSISALFLGMMAAEIVPFGNGALFAGTPIFLFGGGLAQLIAAIILVMAGVTFAGIAFGTFAGFWLSTGFLLLLFENGIIMNGAAATIEEQEFRVVGDGFGAFAMVWAVWFFTLFLVSFRLPLSYVTLLGLLPAAAAFLAGGWWSATGDLFNGWVNAGGWLLIIAAANGFYLAISEYLVSLGGKPLPMGPVPAAGLWATE